MVPRRAGRDITTSGFRKAQDFCFGQHEFFGGWRILGGAEACSGYSDKFGRLRRGVSEKNEKNKVFFNPLFVRSYVNLGCFEKWNFRIKRAGWSNYRET